MALAYYHFKKRAYNLIGKKKKKTKTPLLDLISVYLNTSLFLFKDHLRRICCLLGLMAGMETTKIFLLYNSVRKPIARHLNSLNPWLS